MKNAKPRKGNRSPINDEIEATECRLIDENGEQVGIVSLTQALERAQSVSLDLVQIADADPIVCKIMDYGKKVFEEKKAKAAAKKKQKQTQIKEMKFRPNTDDGDYKIKLRNVVRFLEDGDKAKISLRFRGREMAHQDLGMKLMERIEEDLKDQAVVEQRPKLEGRQMIMVMAPAKKK
ncbi:translation initiation factor IF-3 [Salinispirillum marinum]|uniref:Translation initiation factor IF-3 n=2 Tax=Saccharospirillaceae TaxID=255527 RepID=A0ABV8BF65_9GAMM